MRYAYDLDGTLAHTRDAVVTAYRRVGVEPPSDFFGKTWAEWLPNLVGSIVGARRIHDAKNVEYLQIVRDGLIAPTRIRDLALTTGGVIVTGASSEAAHAVKEAIGLGEFQVFAELTLDGKIRTLNKLSRDGGIVFEDSPDAVLRIRKETRWTACLV
jgi:hypothetical protein